MPNFTDYQLLWVLAFVVVAAGLVYVFLRNRKVKPLDDVDDEAL